MDPEFRIWLFFLSLLTVPIKSTQWWCRLQSGSSSPILIGFGRHTDPNPVNTGAIIPLVHTAGVNLETIPFVQSHDKNDIFDILTRLRYGAHSYLYSFRGPHG